MTFNRYAICFQHDNSPLDKCLFIHKIHAEKEMAKMQNAKKLKVNKVELKINLSYI